MVRPDFIEPAAPSSSPHLLLLSLPDPKDVYQRMYFTICFEDYTHASNIVQTDLK